MLLALKMEEEATSQECRHLLEAGKHMETDHPLEPSEGMQSYQNLRFNPVRLISDFNIQKFKTMILYCFKQLNL